MSQDMPDARPYPNADAVAGRCAARLAGDTDRIDCTPDHARGIIAAVLSEHAGGLVVRERNGGDPVPVKYVLREGKALASLQVMAKAFGDARVPAARAWLALYVAERGHLVSYGRPIFGDAYRAMPTGPVPLVLERVMEGDYGLLADPARFRDGLAVDRGYAPASVGEPDLGKLSRTDVEALQAAAAECLDGRPRSTWLRQVDRGWRLTPMGGFIDWGLHVDPGEPDGEALLDEIRTYAAYGA